MTRAVDICCHKCGKNVRETGSWLRLVKGTDKWECAHPCDTKPMTNEEKLLGSIEDAHGQGPATEYDGFVHDDASNHNKDDE